MLFEIGFLKGENNKEDLYDLRKFILKNQKEWSIEKFDRHFCRATINEISGILVSISRDTLLYLSTTLTIRINSSGTSQTMYRLSDTSCSGTSDSVSLSTPPPVSRLLSDEFVRGSRAFYLCTLFKYLRSTQLR